MADSRLSPDGLAVSTRKCSDSPFKVLVCPFFLTGAVSDSGKNMAQQDIIRILVEFGDKMDSDDIKLRLQVCCQSSTNRQLRQLRFYRLVEWERIGQKYVYWIKTK